jgi:hypothetical protein
MAVDSTTYNESLHLLFFMEKQNRQVRLLLTHESIFRTRKLLRIGFYQFNQIKIKINMICVSTALTVKNIKNHRILKSIINDREAKHLLLKVEFIS